MRVESKWALSILNKDTGRTLLHSALDYSGHKQFKISTCLAYHLCSKIKIFFTDLKVSTRPTCKTSGIFARCYCMDTYLIEKTA